MSSSIGGSSAQIDQSTDNQKNRAILYCAMTIEFIFRKARELSIEAEVARRELRDHVVSDMVTSLVRGLLDFAKTGTETFVTHNNRYACTRLANGILERTGDYRCTGRTDIDVGAVWRVVDSLRGADKEPEVVVRSGQVREAFGCDENLPLASFFEMARPILEGYMSYRYSFMLERLIESGFISEMVLNPETEGYQLHRVLAQSVSHLLVLESAVYGGITIKFIIDDGFLPGVIMGRKMIHSDGSAVIVGDVPEWLWDRPLKYDDGVVAVFSNDDDSSTFVVPSFDESASAIVSNKFIQIANELTAAGTIPPLRRVALFAGERPMADSLRRRLEVGVELAPELATEERFDTLRHGALTCPDLAVRLLVTEYASQGGQGPKAELARCVVHGMGEELLPGSGVGTLGMSRKMIDGSGRDPEAGL